MTRRAVAIDGPSGSGKSTIARGLAEALGSAALDTGAMYRAVTLAVLDAKVAPDDVDRVAAIAERAKITVGDRVELDARDVTSAIRGTDVTAAVSAVSANPEVRRVLRARQRAWADAHPDGVVEGRDIAPVVLPDAALKVFLTASSDERARRRHDDPLDASRGTGTATVQADLARRDQLDARTTPLEPTPDAVVIDTTTREVADVVEELAARYRQALETAR